MQDDIRERNKEIEEGVFKATDIRKRPWTARGGKRSRLI